MDRQTELERVNAVVDTYEALRRAAVDLDRQNIGQARDAVAAALRSLGQYPIPTDL